MEGRVVWKKSDEGEVKGISIGRRTIEDLVLKIANSTEPRIFPEVEVIEIMGKKVVVNISI